MRETIAISTALSLLPAALAAQEAVATLAIG